LSSTHNSNVRQSLRQLIRARRQALSVEQQQLASTNLTAQLSQHERVVASSNIAIYLANDGELDPHGFIDWCWQHHKKVYLPVIHPFTKGHLLFLRYTTNSKMVANCFGILEPILDVRDICPIEKLDVLCTPLVAFDRSGNRLGMGGGFYDRTLATWHKKQEQKLHATPYPIGLAHDCQKVENIPCENWDIPIPEIITPSHNYIAEKCTWDK